jgi:hypothetical protein
MNLNNKSYKEEPPLVKNEETPIVKNVPLVEDEKIFRVKDAKNNPTRNKFNCQIILDPSNKYKIRSDLDPLACTNTKYTMYSKAPNLL